MCAQQERANYTQKDGLGGNSASFSPTAVVTVLPCHLVYVKLDFFLFSCDYSALLFIPSPTLCSFSVLTFVTKMNL